MIIDEDVYLEHFGVRGMKWGVRNNRQTSGENGKNHPESKTYFGLTKKQALSASA